VSTCATEALSPSTQAMGHNRPGRDNPGFNGHALDILELQSVRAAMQFARNMMAWSRTPKAGKLRMLVVRYVIFGEPTVDEIAFRMNVTPRRVFRVRREVLCDCQPLLKLLSRLGNDDPMPTMTNGNSIT
jgi:hypothetical protein